MGVAITLDDISLSYGDNTVLDGLSLQVEAGEFTALVGPSGCGKSTLLSVIAGFLRPRSGRVLIDGQDITAWSPRDRDVSLVFQDYALFPHLTVDQNVAFGLKARGVAKREIPARVEEALLMTGLSGFGGKYPRHLSGGQRQRVALARSLVTEPRLLLLDEPLSNLDAKLRREMRLELKELQARVGTTTLLVTHDQEEALSMAHRVAILGKGRVEQYDVPEAVYQRPASQFVAEFMGETNSFEVDEERLENGRVVLLRQGFAMGLAEPGVEGSRVLVRPEQIEVVRADPGLSTPGLPGVVQTVVYLGQAVQYVIRLDRDGQLVFARSGPAGARLETDQAVVVRWSPASAMIPGNTASAARGRSEVVDVTGASGTPASLLEERLPVDRLGTEFR